VAVVREHLAVNPQNGEVLYRNASAVTAEAAAGKET